MNVFRRCLVSATRYLNIVLFKTYANLKGEIEKTYIGCFWWVIEPLLNTAVFYMVFTRFLHVRTPNFTVFLYIGMVVYGYFSSALQNGANAIGANSGLIQQVYLPKWLFVIISISNLSWKFLFSLVVLFPLVWFNHMPVTWAYLALPFLLVLQFASAVLLALPLAALLPYFPDGRTVLATVLSVGMWFSGVFYELDKVPETVRPYFFLNPMAAFIDATRAVLIGGRWPDPAHLLPGLVVVAAFGLAGAAALKRIDRKVAKLAL